MEINVLVFLAAGFAIGLLVGYLLAIVILSKKYNKAAQVAELERKLGELQLHAASMLPKSEVADKYVSKELYASICSEKESIFSELQKEKSMVEVNRTTILQLTGEMEQRITKNELAYHYVAKVMYEKLEVQYKQLAEDNRNKDELIMKANMRLSEGAAYIEFLEEKLTVQKEEAEAFQQKSLVEFENIANRVLRSKSTEFTELNKANLEAIVKPLNDEIGRFKTRVEEVYEKEAKQRFSLEEKVKDLVQQTNKVSAEANNLAAALKGQVKKQGNWGEVILENILEKSGLVKNREYFVQPTIKTDNGKNARPDVLLQLPDNRTIIIDAKVSLVAYDRFWNCEVKEQQDQCLQEHLRSMYSHINDLHSKKYDNIDTALDFTMMFVPIEPAYLLAIQHDAELWNHAYDKRILLISPTNLIASLKLIADIWKREHQGKNAMEIVKRGELLYEKFAGFTNTLAAIGTHLGNAQSAYDTALSQLKHGQGNLIWQAVQLKNMGLKSNKSLPSNWQTTAITEGDESTHEG